MGQTTLGRGRIVGRLCETPWGWIQFPVTVPVFPTRRRCGRCAALAWEPDCQCKGRGTSFLRESPGNSAPGGSPSARARRTLSSSITRRNPASILLTRFSEQSHPSRVSRAARSLCPKPKARRCRATSAPTTFCFLEEAIPLLLPPLEPTIFSSIGFGLLGDLTPAHPTSSGR